MSHLHVNDLANLKQIWYVTYHLHIYIPPTYQISTLGLCHKTNKSFVRRYTIRQNDQLEKIALMEYFVVVKNVGFYMVRRFEQVIKSKMF